MAGFITGDAENPFYVSFFSQKGKSLSWPPSCQSGRRELQLRRDQEGAREHLAGLEELTSQARWMTSQRTEGKRQQQNWDLLGIGSRWRRANVPIGENRRPRKRESNQLDLCPEQIHNQPMNCQDCEHLDRWLE